MARDLEKGIYSFAMRELERMGLEKIEKGLPFEVTTGFDGKNVKPFRIFDLDSAVATKWHPIDPKHPTPA